MQSSGKLVILGILIVAFASAAASWWFRYDATHRAAEFWGPEATRLIRDAPAIGLIELRPATDAERNNPPPDFYDFGGESTSLSRNRPQRGGQAHFAPKTSLNEPVPDGSMVGSKYVSEIHGDITGARGLLHLRNALLERRSYHWNQMSLPRRQDVTWKWVLLFMNPAGGTTITFSEDGQYVMTEDRRIASSAPIAAGLVEIFPELAANAVPPADTATY